MGMIARVLEFVRKDGRRGAKIANVTADPGGGANITLQQLGPLGDDSQPLRDDYVAAMAVRRSGGAVAVAYADVNNEGVAEPGEKRVYARDSSGSAVCEIHLKNDASIVISNDQGSITLGASGDVTIDSQGEITLESSSDVTINGLTIDSAGNLSTTGTITAGIPAVGLTTHVHGGVTTGSGSTGPGTG